MNRALLRKDIALLNETIHASIALLALSYVLAAVLVFTGNAGEVSWNNILAGGASITRFTSILICALIGGHVYGREREEGSIHFLDQLPLTGTKILISKLTVSAGILAFIWIASMTMLLIGLHAMGHEVETNLRVLEAMTRFVASGVLVFGGAWLSSFFVSSAIGASFAGMMLLMPAYFLPIAFRWAFELQNSASYQLIVALITGSFGVASIAASFQLQALRSAVQPFLFLRAARNAHAKAENASSHSLSSLRAVLWKDFRLVRMSLFLGLSVLIAPYPIGSVAWTLLPNAPEYFRGASLISIATSVIVYSFWAGQIMSAEHTGKTVQFSSYLPVPRYDAILSKLLVAFLPALVMAVLNATALLVADKLIPSQAHFGEHFSWDDWNQNGFIVFGCALLNGTCLAFSVSWLHAARRRKPVPAIVSGILAVPFLVLIWASTSSALSEGQSSISPLAFVLGFSVCTAALGTIAVFRGIAISIQAGE